MTEIKHYQFYKSPEFKLFKVLPLAGRAKYPPVMGEVPLAGTLKQE